MVFKDCADELSPVITDLFNLCLANNKIPDEWKIALVTPIYKGKGSKSSLDNFRPISILSPISKVFEALLGQKMRVFLEKNGFLHQDQNGFRDGRSCHLALNTFVDYTKRNLHSKNHVISIFLDLSKAFDTIDHQLLLIKLNKYGFSSNALDLIKNYLENRVSIVCFDGKSSSKEILKSGVPQGSILGPLLFIIFINDFCFLDLKGNKTMFADDTTLYLAGTSLWKIACDLECDLVVIADWLKHNRLLLNVKKSNAMIFKWRYQLHLDVLNTNIDAQDEISILCDGEKIPFVKKFRLLGVILDEYLSFDLHTIELCQKVNWKISILKRSSYLFHLNFRTILYKLFIMSKYDYCSTLFFYFADKCNQERLEKNFVKSLKSYLNIKLLNLSLDEQFTVLKSFNILPLQLRFFQNMVFFIFSLMKGNRESYILNNIKVCKKTKNLRSNFSEPISKTALYKYSFFMIAIRLLNSFIFNLVSLNEKSFRSIFTSSILVLYEGNKKFWT